MQTKSEGRGLKISLRLGDWLFLMLFAAAAALIFWRCPYGYASPDESFYPSIPYRLLLGDALFVHEWHLTQLFSFLLYPFVSLFLKINGSLEGIFLADRYLCAALHSALGLFAYIRLREISRVGAGAAGLCLTVFVPFNIMSLSYYDGGNVLLTAALLVLLTARRMRSWQYFLAGLLFAQAVLCNPYLVLLYGIYALWLLWLSLRPGLRGKWGEGAFTGYAFVRISAGCGLMALLFFVFLFARESPGEFLEALPLLFTDPEHSIPFGEKLLKFFSSMVLAGGLSSLLIYGLFLVLFLVCLADKRRMERRVGYFACALALTALLMWDMAQVRYINHLMWGLNAAALFAFMLSEKPLIRRLFMHLWLPGMIFAFCQHLCSNDNFYTFSGCSVVSLTGSLPMLLLFTEELCREGGRVRRALLRSIAAAFVIFQLATLCLCRINMVFWEDGNISAQRFMIDEGVQKGLVVSQTEYGRYEKHMRGLEALDAYGAGKRLYLTETTWLYLARDFEFASFSAWPSGVNEKTVERLALYYEHNPDKLPDAVYAESPDRPTAELFCARFGYTLTDWGDFLILLPEG